MTQIKKRRPLALPDAVILGAGLAAAASLFYTLLLVWNTFTENTGLREANEQLRLEASLAHIYFEEAMNGGEGIDLGRDVYANVDSALALCQVVLQAQGIGTGVRPPTITSEAGANTTALCERLQAWRGLTEARWQDRQSGQPDDKVTAYDDTFDEIIRLAEKDNADIATMIEQNEAGLQIIALALAVIFIALIVGAATVVFRGRRAIETKNTELEERAAELSSEVAERTQAQAALTHERDLLQALMDNVPDTIYFKDTASRFTRINRAQAAVLGVDRPEDAIGRTDLDFQAEALAREFYAEEQRLVESGQPIIDRVEFNSTSDGQPRWFSATKVPIKDAKGEVTGIVGVSRNVTARIQAEGALRAAEARYRTLVEQLPAITYVVTLGEVNQTTYISPQVETLLGFSPDEWLADPDLWRKQIHPDDLEAVLAEVTRSDERSEPLNLDYRVLTRDGRVLWFRNQSKILRDDAGQARYSQGLMLDITQRKHTEEALQEAHQKQASWVKELEQRTSEIILLSRMGEMLQTAVTAQDAYTIIAQFVERLFPTQAGAVYLISASRNFVEAVTAWGEVLAAPEQRIFAPDECWALRRGRAHRVSDIHSDLRCQHVDPSSWSSYLCVPMMAQGEALGVLHLAAAQEQMRLTEAHQGLAQTVAEQLSLALANLRLRETLRNQSIRDALTGLFNRRYLEETLERELYRAARSQHPLGIIMLDLDHFKRFNDTFGHDAGDLVLRELGQLLQAHIRGSDIACRYGGEEFTLILPEAPLETTRERAETLRIAVKHLVVQHRGQPLGALSMSLGVAAFPEHGAAADGLLYMADQALYQAKREGRDRVVVAE